MPWFVILFICENMFMYTCSFLINVIIYAHLVRSKILNLKVLYTVCIIILQVPAEAFKSKSMTFSY